MAEPGSYEVLIDVEGGSPPQQRSSRKLVAGTAIAAVMLLAVAMQTSEDTHRAALVSAAKMMGLYAELEVPRKMALMAMEHTPKVEQELALSLASNEPMLADCANKAVYTNILVNFKSLQGNLTVENQTRYQTDLDLFTAKDSAYKEWLDSESAFRTAQTAKEQADSAAEYARGKFSEYKKAVEVGEEDYEKNIAPTIEEKKGLALQKEMIETLEGIVGKMSSSAAEATPAKLSDAKAKLAAIEAKNPQLGKLAGEVDAILSKISPSSPASPAAAAPAAAAPKAAARKLLESDFEGTVKQALVILGEMKAEVSTRITEIDTAIAKSSADLKANREQKLSWEVKVVDLSNTADRANADKNAADLQREKLAGAYKAKNQAYVDGHEGLDGDLKAFKEQIDALQAVIDKVKELLAKC